MTFTVKDSPLSVGPLGGCTFCAYELEGQGAIGGSAKIPVVPATVTIGTDKGPRAVCDEHARRGTWKGAPVDAR